MKIVIPMAGSGARFREAGYTDPKPLIKLNDGKRIIERVLEMFTDPEDEFVFICNDEHLEKTNMRAILRELKPECNIVSMPPHKLGPVFTVMAAERYIRDDEPVIVCYCDLTMKWYRKEFEKWVNANHLDGCILTHTGFHPHTLSSTKMAFVKPSGSVLISEVKEKASYTSTPELEHASSGVYWFKRGLVMKMAFQTMLNNKVQAFNNEYYVTLSFNLMIEQGLRVGYYDTYQVAILGTPHEVQNFEAWQTIVKNPFLTNEEDVLRCYRYWKEWGHR